MVETIQLYTLEEAEKLISYKRRKAHRKKMRQLKQKFVLKFISLICIIGSIAIPFISPIDGSAVVAVLAIGLIGLVIPFDMEITW